MPRRAERAAARRASIFCSSLRIRPLGDVEAACSRCSPALIEHRGVVESHVMLQFIATACGQAERWDEGLRRVDEGIALSEAANDAASARRAEVRWGAQQSGKTKTSES